MPDVQLWLNGLFFGGSGSGEAPQNVSLVHAGSQQAACAYAARTVRSGVLSGLRYRDFTVCMTDEAAYRLPMQTLFSRAGIPVYCASSALCLLLGHSRLRVGKAVAAAPVRAWSAHGAGG